MEISCMLETITPDKAKAYLQRNTNNYRSLNHSVVRKYAKDMKNGRWESNGEAIKFDENGVLKIVSMLYDSIYDYFLHHQRTRKYKKKESYIESYVDSCKQIKADFYQNRSND